MRLKIKNDYTSLTKHSQESIETEQEIVRTAIRDLEKLYDIRNLSDEEIKRIVARYYEMDLIPRWTISFAEMDGLCSSIFKTKSIALHTFDTNIITLVSDETKELSYLNVIAYVPMDSDFAEQTYSFEELQELIRTRKIVFYDYEWSDKEITEEAASKADLTEEYKLTTLDKIDETDFCGYDDIIIPRLKNKLQKGKVARDILRIINSMRARLKNEQSRLAEERRIMYAKLNENTSAMALRTNYMQELSNIVVLDRKKKG